MSIMRVHLAECSSYIRDFIQEGFLRNVKFNILFSFAFHNEIEIYQKNARNIIVDSGAFTFQKKGIQKLDKYMKSYLQFIEKYSHMRNVYFVEMDIYI